MNRQQNNEAQGIHAGAHKSHKKENASLYFVVWVNGQPATSAEDPARAEEIAAEVSRNRSGCSVWITKEDRPPEGVKIDRRTAAARIYDDFVQDEQKRSACRCCANCGNYCTEYGETFCRFDAIPETADPLKFDCPEWV